MTKLIKIQNIPAVIQEHVDEVIAQFDFKLALECIAKNESLTNPETKLAAGKVEAGNTGLTHSIIKSDSKYYILTEYLLGSGRYAHVRLGIPINHSMDNTSGEPVFVDSSELVLFKSWKLKTKAHANSLGTTIFRLIYNMPASIPFIHKVKLSQKHLSDSSISGKEGAYLKMPILPMTLESWIKNESQSASVQTLLTICKNMLTELKRLHSLEFIIPKDKDWQEEMFIKTDQTVLNDGDRAFKFIHRDIKLQNITINNETKKIFFCDFDFAVLENGAQQDAWGSSYYMPPECESHVTQRLDIYAIAGCLGLVLQDREVMQNKKSEDKTYKKKSSLDDHRPIFLAQYKFNLKKLGELMLTKLGNTSENQKFVAKQVKILVGILNQLGAQNFNERPNDLSEAIEKINLVYESYSDYIANDAAMRENINSSHSSASSNSQEMYFVDPMYKNYAITVLEEEAKSIESSVLSRAGKFLLKTVLGDDNRKKEAANHTLHVVIPKIRRGEGLTRDDMDLINRSSGLRKYFSHSKTRRAQILQFAKLKPQT